MQKIKRTFHERRVLLFRLSVVVLLLLLTFSMMSQAAQARTTYVITDGNRVLEHMTYATDPAAVLTEAGFTLGEEDTFTVQADGEISEITVTRLQTIHILDGGRELELGTYGGTVADILNQLGIVPGDDILVNQELHAPTADGMTIEVTYIERQTEVYIQTVPFETICYVDETLEPGEEKILVPGQDGTARCTAQVVYTNGVETERTVVEETMVRNPVTQIVVSGLDRSLRVQQGSDRTFVDILSSIGFGSNESPGQAGAIVSDDGSSFTTASGETVSYTRKIQVEATAYCKQGTTAVGTQARYGAIAVDPSVIPYGTRMYIVSNDGQYIYGYATAEDCGNFRGAAIDLFYLDEDFCWEFGRRSCTVYILG